MSASRVTSCFLIAAGAYVAAAGFQGSGGGPLFFEGARLIAGDGSAPIESSAFLVEGDSFTWVGRKGERQPPPGAVRVDLTGKTVMPSLIDGHNHIGLVNEKDGSNSKANYTHENLVDQMQRYVYGVSAAMSMGLEADQELAYQLRDEVIPNAARFLTVGRGLRGPRLRAPRESLGWAFRTAREQNRKAGRTSRNCARVACTSSRCGWTTGQARSRKSNRRCTAPSSPRPTPTAWKYWPI